MILRLKPVPQLSARLAQLTKARCIFVLLPRHKLFAIHKGGGVWQTGLSSRLGSLGHPPGLFCPETL